jgi:excisionase family DNA binding protein
MRGKVKQNRQRENGTLHLPRQTAASGTSIPFGERLTCTIAEACEATGLGRTKLYELIGDGRVDTATIGRRRLVKVRSLRRLVQMEDE